MTDEPKSKLPPAPGYLQNDEAREEWMRAGNYLVAAGQLDDLRLAYLEVYCSFFGWITQSLLHGDVPSEATLAQLRLMQQAYGIPVMPEAHGLH